MVFTTNGIVLRTTRYGETSIITQIYTELFGIQSYIVKGVHQSTRRKPVQAVYFQPGAILALEVYHHQQKQLQFIKEFSWSYIYQNVLNDVKRHTVTLYIVELLQHSLQQPEAHVELFYLTQEALQLTDTGNDVLVANLPIYFTLQAAAILGFQIQGLYNVATPWLDLQEGFYVSTQPNHVYFMEKETAKATAALLQIMPKQIETIGEVVLNQSTRRAILQALQLYLSLHIPGFGKLKSLDILQEILSA
ncbi:MAG: DNA repair protein RecO [Sphingobacteriales bacterium]|uniref:DNA repair protein RecO n=1 Tax=Hydrotalea flava TaxID=714549 RepID=UPI0008366208|nr:DNA repair protein RecO [Hydrotalea flava]RTL54235.1 MAG: DNA repair protein RecO [Sphingobacteriales bacterium]